MSEDTIVYHDIIGKFTNKNILVIGDFILDVYLKGVSTRLSPEAPVPVVDVNERQQIPGGAGNVVSNLRALGASVTLCTVIGDDHEGSESASLLENLGVKTTSIVRAQDRRTISKTRVMAGNHVITRVDQGDTAPLEEHHEDVLIQFITQSYEAAEAVLISDYDKGVITPKILSAIIRLQARWPKFLAVDSKRLEFFHKLHPFLVKPNYDECIRLLELPHVFASRAEQIAMYATHLYEKVNAEIIAVTLDNEGSLIIETGQMVHRCVAPAIVNPQVSGAGDTYLSAFMLAYITSIDSKASAEIANAAAAIAVKKPHTSSCANIELRNYFNVQKKFITSLNELAALCNEYRAQGRKIVFTNGCFDILHSGHVTYLHCAKELGDILIVGLNSDESIKRLKGETRPINPLPDRLKVLSGLTSVDHIITFGDANDDTPIPVIKVVKPNIFVKGGDYTKDKLPEASTVEELGGKITFLPHIPDHSTTSIINKITNAAMSDHALLSKMQ